MVIRYVAVSLNGLAAGASLGFAIVAIARAGLVRRLLNHCKPVGRLPDGALRLVRAVVGGRHSNRAAAFERTAFRRDKGGHRALRIGPLYDPLAAGTSRGPLVTYRCER